VSADRGDRADRRNRDQRGDQTVLNCCGASFISDETAENGDHSNTSLFGECRNLTNNCFNKFCMQCIAFPAADSGALQVDAHVAMRRLIARNVGSGLNLKVGSMDFVPNC
jgi:hypothetical protein